MSTTNNDLRVFREFVNTLPEAAFPHPDRAPRHDAAPIDDHQLSEMLIIFIRTYYHDTSGRGPTLALIADSLERPHDKERIGHLLQVLRTRGRVTLRGGFWYIATANAR